MGCERGEGVNIAKEFFFFATMTSSCVYAIYAVNTVTNVKRKHLSFPKWSTMLMTGVFSQLRAIIAVSSRAALADHLFPFRFLALLFCPQMNQSPHSSLFTVRQRQGKRPSPISSPLRIWVSLTTLRPWRFVSNYILRRVTPCTLYFNNGDGLNYMECTAIRSIHFCEFILASSGYGETLPLLRRERKKRENWGKSFVMRLFC